MIPRACKRLAEVDFPIAAVSRHAAREKSIRHGHPSTLHLWWARRPLASSRAVLLALLLPDPCDPHCPEGFKEAARQALLAMHGRPQGWGAAAATDEGLRRTVLRFIADFADWSNAANRPYLEAGRALVKAAHGEDAPLVVDPFAGGGSIPLEALRLGCEAFASDLNPVACLIRGGWTITGSWSIATEMGSRLRARDSAALATSIHLICRPRPEDAPVGDWADVLRELPERVAAWMERLQGEGVRGADLVFACIGPALEIFSRCRAVETAEGRGVGFSPASFCTLR